eukprot:Gb_18906 [translate_table: standard]
MGTSPSLVSEIGPDGIPGEVPIIAYTEKLLEEKELQLKKYIQENYSKIRDVERELSNLTLELKLTAGPKKAALEHLRKKIEVSTEKIRVAKQKEDQARKVWEAAAKALKEEEANKQRICEDLNRLVQESASAQYSRLEELKRRLEALNPEPKGVAPESDATRIVPLAPSNAGILTGALSQQSNSESHDNTSAISNNLQSLQNHSASSRPAKLSHEKKDVDESHPNGRGQSASQVAVAQHVSINKGRGHNIGRGKGNLVLQKPKGETAPGWTGAGFDVDART